MFMGGLRGGWLLDIKVERPRGDLICHIKKFKLHWKREGEPSKILSEKTA